MDIFLSRGAQDPEVRIRFPAEPDMVWPMLTELDEHCVSSDPVRIVGTSSPILNLTQYISSADMEEAADICKLNALAEMVDGMSAEEQRTFSGALDAERINGLDDVLRIAGSLDIYELFPNIKTDEELGYFLVDTGPITGKFAFPDEVKPYLDYARIGAERRKRLGGVHTPKGFMKRKEAAQAQSMEDKSRFRLTLASSTSSVRLNLPAADTELARAKRALGLDSLNSADIREVEVNYPWAHLLSMGCITLEDANTLAECVQSMTEQEQRVFGAVLEVEEPRSLREAGAIAMDINDYELVEGSERAYGLNALRYAGAGDEILELLDGFTDFDALGRSEMEADGVRGTSFGHVRCLSGPWPEQRPEQAASLEMGGICG